MPRTPGQSGQEMPVTSSPRPGAGGEGIAAMAWPSVPRTSAPSCGGAIPGRREIGARVSRRPVSAAEPGTRHAVVGWTLVLAAIAYLDRVCISTAAPAIRAELGL